MLQIRDYRTSDERSWLTCRLLSFFDTDYYDEVKICKTTFASARVELVACRGDVVVGLIDVEIDGDTATIDSIAVHPDAQRHGIASKLLRHAVQRLPERVTSLDAWTRETASANDWYTSAGFAENYRYLHVYKESASGGTTDLSLPLDCPHPCTPSCTRASNSRMSFVSATPVCTSAANISCDCGRQAPVTL